MSVVVAQTHFFHELRGNLARVAALGITGAGEESAAPAIANDHGLAAVFAVDVGRDHCLAIEARCAGGGGVFADDLGRQLARLIGAFFEQWEVLLHLLKILARQLLDHLGAAALGEARAAKERAALAVAQKHVAAALLAFDAGLNGRRLGWKRLSFFVEIDNRRAGGLALLVLHRIAAASEKFAKAPAPLDHVAAADGAFIFAHLAQRWLALQIDRLGRLALLIGAGQEEAVLADAIEHLLAALGAVERAFRAAGMLKFSKRPLDDLVERAVKIAEQLHPVQVFLFDLIELTFHARRALHVHDVGKGLDQLVGDDLAQQRRMKTTIDLLHILAILNRLNDAGIGAGPADTKLLQLLDQRGLGKPGRRLREMLRGINIDRPDRLPL